MSKAADYAEIQDVSVEDDTKLISLGEQLERRVCEFFDALACLSNDSTSIECLSNDGPSTAIESLIEQILPLSATSIAGLRAKALVVWFEARPRWLWTGPHHHEWGWQNDAAMSLFYDIADLTGLAPMVARYEAKLYQAAIDSERAAAARAVRWAGGVSNKH
jgi:hypothetical protein